MNCQPQACYWDTCMNSKQENNLPLQISLHSTLPSPLKADEMVTRKVDLFHLGEMTESLDTYPF